MDYNDTNHIRMKDHKQIQVDVHEDIAKIIKPRAPITIDMDIGGFGVINAEVCTFHYRRKVENNMVRLYGKTIAEYTLTPIGVSE